MSLAACTGLTELNLPRPLYEFPLNVRRCTRLLSTVSCPHLQKITFTIGVDPYVFSERIKTDPLSYEEWRAFEDALLEVSLRSRDTLEVVMICLAGSVRSIPSCENFFLRFREVGKVKFEIPLVYG
jgi:hypothetical protein